jgi:hypothetical protein
MTGGRARVVADILSAARKADTMVSQNVQKVLSAVHDLSPLEREQLRRLLWDDGVRTSAMEDVDRNLIAKGILSSVPPTRPDAGLYRKWSPVPVAGKPVSQTLVEERR